MLGNNLPLTSIIRAANGSWTFTWAAVLGVTSYRVVLQGVQQGSPVTTTAYTWARSGFATSPPSLEVVPVGQLALSEVYSPIFIGQWYGESGAVRYAVQEAVAAAWVSVAVVEEVGIWASTYQSPPLVDGVTYNYQVIAVDAYGNQSPARHYTRLVVTPPAAPAVVVSYGGGPVALVTTS